MCNLLILGKNLDLRTSYDVQVYTIYENKFYQLETIKLLINLVTHILKMKPFYLHSNILSVAEVLEKMVKLLCREITTHTSQ